MLHTFIQLLFLITSAYLILCGNIQGHKIREFQADALNDGTYNFPKTTGNCLVTKRQY